MLEYVGFIGYGFVGKACHKAFEFNVKPIIIDPKYSERSINDLVTHNVPLTFISINAPTLEDRTLDTTSIYNVFQQLADIGYTGLVVLKSTLTPDIVQDLYRKFGKDSTMKKDGPLRFIYSPEFLREAHWEKDAISPSMIIMAGNFFDCRELEDIYKKHSHLKGYVRFYITSYDTASLIKYTINSYLANKVVFMNQLYQLFADIDGKLPHKEVWNEFTEILATDPRFGHSHLDVPGSDGKFGYGGSCFPKDVKAFIGFDKNNRLSVLRETELANTKIRLMTDKDEDKK